MVVVTKSMANGCFGIAPDLLVRFQLWTAGSVPRFLRATTQKSSRIPAALVCPFLIPTTPVILYLVNLLNGR